MDLVPSESTDIEHSTLHSLLERALLLDLEISHHGRMLKLGAALGDWHFTGSGGNSISNISAELEAISARADCLLGHNLIQHDLPALRTQAPGLSLLRLPLIDTLVLSPICFPENPYHRLVKDYKLVRESVNDPVADARQAARLFADEFNSLCAMGRSEPQLLELLHFLLATADEPEDHPAAGMDLVFAALGSCKPHLDKAVELCREWFARSACASFPADAALFRTNQQRLAVAYAITWLRVAGSNSVLPPWVRLQHPLTGDLLWRLREVPCQSPGCRYCRTVHNPEQQLRRFFGWDTFRSTPTSQTGGSLQRQIVDAGLRNESLLAILPTGGGKSLCYQLPALTRNFRRGVLTLVISPLQALMKDQVDGLVRRTHTTFAAALYGLLTPLERGDVLRRVALGDVAILYVSPEQLRNRSFTKAIQQREIGCWVFDEAHCLSKWGHDFRPDYLYAGRFIREFATRQGVVIPAIACFTATAKQDVKQEIIEFFWKETGRELALYEGGVERENLRFEVQAVSAPAKLERVHDLLSERLPPSSGGSAIVFRSTREATQVTAEYLAAKDWPVEAFHAGLIPPEKKRIQDAFLSGEVRVICATNAFGMGIDKEDVRLVIHADTPGSLENYLQEAGRAGRDGVTADCVLLYEEADCEQQFRMGARSRLTRRDIAQILRGLRKAAKGERQEVVITAGEILRDQDVDTSIRLEDRDADTKVRTAVAWLERAGFIQRNENATQVFQARPLVKDLEDATQRIASLDLSQPERGLWLAILREVINSGPAEHLSVDQLALLPEFVRYAETGRATSPEYVSAKVLKVLASMAQAGLMKRDTLLNAFVRYKVEDHSRRRLEKLLQLDRRLVDLLATEEPDPEGWMPLSLRLLNQRLSEENFECSVEILGALLKSLSEDGRGFAGMKGSIEVRPLSRDSCRIRLNRGWADIGQLAEKRRRVALLVLDTLVAKIPADTPACADLLVSFSFEELQDAVTQDLWLRSELKDVTAAFERALMYLHEQRVVILQQGLAIFRPAMTIQLLPEAKGEKYRPGHFQPLEHYYNQRTVQVHVMGEYARRGLQHIGEALQLVLAYFSLGVEEFIRRYFSSKLDLLKHATTAQSFERIVTALADRAQVAIVTAPVTRNMLILAGPGSGKTRTVVHRCAYLLRVERVPPQSILVCCFNRQAAIELRHRLNDLAGDEAKGVTVVTYHGLAMRLLGYSFTSPAEKGAPIDYDALIARTVQLLRGEIVLAGVEADELRDRLLAGFQYILVDEYQDIDQAQYDMISAIAGRTLGDPDLKLSILAVGDDDQNIYGFRGTNVGFIRQFRQDYDAEVHYLIENYRSTAFIIDAANRLIAANLDRMKTDHPIRINRSRQLLPPGGEFGQIDPGTGGKVQIIRADNEPAQTAAALAELLRLHQFDVPWSEMAALSKTHHALAEIRSSAESDGIPIRWVAQRDKIPPPTQIREVHRFLNLLKQNRSLSRRAGELGQMLFSLFSPESNNPWLQFLLRLIADWESESANAEAPISDAIEFFYEACAEGRRDFSYGDGVTLSTIHSAKGTEYNHVLLVGGWSPGRDFAALEENRRLFYVGMTRARKSLAIINRFPLPPELAGPSFLTRAFAQQQPLKPGASLSYDTLSLEDIHLGFPSSFPAEHPIHQHLAQLRPHDLLTALPLDRDRIGLFDSANVCVAQLSKKAAAAWNSRLSAVRAVRVLAMIHRCCEQEEDEIRRQQCRVPEWEVPAVEVVSETHSRPE